ncbi:MAG: RNA-protein complex protein Nop10 [Methanocorpusculum sp.]|nr:RNA-protein complex protein Nop10 [Methanocorpusculum sp.]HJJ41040.1 RNA-protein complex protein Nop10 [Methanocorpusculum sp.]HJJ52869.1 RNA-protein complex protein Nop10 [Methanocorpusculum sp.]
MSGHIRICRIDNIHTLLKICPVCGRETVSVHPARYSPEDRYGRYRRMVKEAHGRS